MTVAVGAQDSPQVSVVIPAYNAEAVIARAIDSVLAQDYAPLEVIVVNDGSTDRTADIVRRYADRGVRLIELAENCGAGGCRNEGIAAAAGPFVAFLDADDEWLPGKLTAQVAAFQAVPDCSLAVCDGEWRDPDGRVVDSVLIDAPETGHDDAWRTMLTKSFIHTSCVLTTKALLERLGGFDTTLVIAEDWDLWIRLGLEGPYAFTRENYVTVHVTPGSLMAREARNAPRYLLPMIARHLETQRARLGASERRRIWATQLERVGLMSCAHGDYLAGAGMVLRAMATGRLTRAGIVGLAAGFPPLRALRGGARGGARDGAAAGPPAGAAAGPVQESPPPQEPGSENLASMSGHMVRGSLWMVAMRWVLRLIGLTSTIILARLLSPADYGIVAMAMVIVGFLTVFTFTNFDLALIQRTDAERAHYDTAWTLQIIQGAVLAATLFLVAPLGARYFDEPRVEVAIRVLALMPLFEGFANIGIVAFRKELDFAKEFRFNTYVRVINFFIIVGFALLLRNYWALIIGTIAAAALRVVISFTMHPFRPRLSLERTRDIWSFSQWMLLFHIGNYLWNKMDAFIVGRVAGVSEMRTYHLASEISEMPTSEVVMPLGRALFPSYTRLAGNPKEAAAAFLRVFGTVSFLCLPLGLGLASVAPEMVHVVLGARWDPVAPLMRWLAVATMCTGLVHTVGTYLSAIGRQRDTAMLIWINLVILAPALAAGGMLNGVAGVAEARTATAAFALLIALYYVTRDPGVSGFGLVVQFWRPALSSAVMIGAVFWVSDVLQAPMAVRLAAEVATGAVVFGATVLALWALSGRPAGPERYVIDNLRRAQARFRRRGGAVVPPAE